MSGPSKDGLKQYLPVQGQKQRYYTLEEVSSHNTANDCWIILFGEVYNLTRIIQENISNALTTPLIQAAGTDITYWFDTNSREPRVRVNL
jgi:cytochrome b involved in lipid metabolism